MPERPLPMGRKAGRNPIVTAMRKADREKLEDSLSWAIRVAGLPSPKRQFRFHPTRKWRSDFAWVDSKLLVEVEGGQWMKKARHTSGTGFEGDCEKYAAAMLLGYRVLRVTAKMVKSGAAVKYIEGLL